MSVASERQQEKMRARDSQPSRRSESPINHAFPLLYLYIEALKRHGNPRLETQFQSHVKSDQTEAINTLQKRWGDAKPGQAGLNRKGRILAP